jgi:hypothetical protein
MEIIKTYKEGSLSRPRTGRLQLPSQSSKINEFLLPFFGRPIRQDKKVQRIEDARAGSIQPLGQ